MTVEYLDGDSLFFDDAPTAPPAPVVQKPGHVEAFDLAADPLGRYSCSCTCGRRYLSRDPAAARRELGRHLVELRGQHVMEVQTR